MPAEWAKAFREDDQKVIRSGKPLINRLEVWYDEQRNLDWFLTTKLPVRDQRGRVIGVMGITRRDEDRMRHHDVREVTAAVQHARKNCGRNLTKAFAGNHRRPEAPATPELVQRELKANCRKHGQHGCS